SPDYENVLKAIDATVADFKANDGRNTYRPVPTPDGFRWKNHPLQNLIFADNNGNFKVKFDVSKLRPIGKQYHVDVINGDDANDGLTPQTALKTMIAAYNKTDITEMILHSGLYNRNDNLWGIDVEKDISIIGAENAKVILACSQNLVPTLNDEYSNVYQMNTQSVSGIYDLKNRNENNDYYVYTQVESISEVSVNPGS